jgi:DNA-binding CsgD family transcriptional regulator
MLLIISSAIGFLDLVLLVILKQHPRFRGAGSLLFPFVPLTLITFLELYGYFLFYRYPGRTFPALLLACEWCIILIAFGWIYLGYRHWSLNGVDTMRWRRVYSIAAFSGLLLIAAALALFRFPTLMLVVHIMVIVMLYAAGIKGVRIIRKTGSLLPASKTAVSIAVLSMLFYPLVAIGEVLGWRFSFLDPSMSFMVQTHPLYVFLVNIPIALFMFRQHRQQDPVSDPGRIQSLLSSREMEVFRLLYRGFRYNEIAEELYLSLATVKTHVQHIYRKLGVSRREELFLKMREAPHEEVPDDPT